MIRETRLETKEVVLSGQYQIKASSVNHPGLGITPNSIIVASGNANARIFVIPQLQAASKKILRFCPRRLMQQPGSDWMFFCIVSLFCRFLGQTEQRMCPRIPPANGRMCGISRFWEQGWYTGRIESQEHGFSCPYKCSFRQKWHFVIPRTTPGDESSTSHPKTPCGPQTKGGFCPLNGRKKRCTHP